MEMISVNKAEENIDNLQLSKMQEHYIYMGIMCILYGVFFTFCLYENLSGITFPFCVAGTIVVSLIYLNKMKIAIKKNFKFYVFGMILLSISTVLTGNGFFHFFNWVGILLLLMTSMIQQLYENNDWSFQKYIVSILVLIGKIITSFITPVTDGIQYKKVKAKGDDKHKYLASILIGSACAVCFLIIVLPLLILSDEIFAGFFGQFLNILRFDRAIAITFTFLFGFFLMYSFLSAISKFAVKHEQNKKAPEINTVTGITFTGILAGVYMFYSVIQILFLFLRMESGLPDGVTYSQYAHSGFWQLLAVSLINFVTVLICISIFKENKILKILLLIISVCTCIMALSAIYRMMLYVGVYYLSFLRVLVLWFLGVLLLIMMGVIWSILKRDFHLFRYIMIVITCCYIGLSFSNVDKIVIQYNLEHWEDVSQNDMIYLLYGSSIDSAPYIAEAAKRTKRPVEFHLDEAVNQYFQNIDDKNMSVRNWNLSLSRAKKEADKYIREEE